MHNPQLQLADFSTILDCFYQQYKHLYRGGGWEVVGSHKVVGYSKAQQFSRWNGLEWDPIALILSQNIAKAMAYIMNKSGDDYQQGGCLYKPTSGIHWTPKHSWRSDRPQKQASEKADQSTRGSGVVTVS